MEFLSWRVLVIDELSMLNSQGIYPQRDCLRLLEVAISTAGAVTNCGLGGRANVMSPGFSIPTISVVIPTCDRPELLRRALKSVMSQTSPANEIIVVNDGRRQLSVTDIGSEVQFMTTSGRQGPHRSRNQGANMASCDFLAFLDDDDYWTVTYLEEVRRAINTQKGRVDVVIARVGRDDGDGDVILSEVLDLSNLRDRLLIGNPGFTNNNTTFNRSFFLRIGGFNRSMPSSEDRALGIAAIDAGAAIVMAPSAVAVVVNHTGRRVSFGFGATVKKVPFVIRHWGMMNSEQRRSNIRRLCLVRRQETASLKSALIMSLPKGVRDLGRRILTSTQR